MVYKSLRVTYVKHKPRLLDPQPAAGAAFMQLCWTPLSSALEPPNRGKIMNQTIPVERHAAASESSRLRRSSILYAEDEPSLRVCLSEHLHQAGYDVTTAEDGEQ